MSNTTWALIFLGLLIFFVKALFWIGKTRESNRKSLAKKILNELEQSTRDGKTKSKIKELRQKYRIKESSTTSKANTFKKSE